MPKIPQYTNTEQIDTSPLVNAARTIENSAYQSGQAIRQAGAAINQGIGDLEQHLAQNETTKLAADVATAHAQLSAQWAETVQKADPNDHELAQRFMEKNVQPVLDKMGDGLITAQGQNMFAKASAGLRADLFMKSTADQMNLAGMAAVTNLDTMKNQISGAVRNDPTNWQGSVNLADAAIDGMVQSYGLKSEQALQLRQQIHSEIARSAAMGMLEKNPQAGMDAINRGDFNDYVDGTTQKSLLIYGGRLQRASAAADRAAVVEQHRQDKEAFNSEMTKVQASTIDDKGNVAIPPDYFKTLVHLSQMPGADPASIRAAENMGRAVLKEAEAGKKTVTDPAYYDDFSRRAFLPDSDPHKLTLAEVDQARANGSLSDKDRSFFRSAIADQAKNPQQTADMRDLDKFTKSMKGYITKSSFMNTDALGDQRFYEFQSNATNLYKTMKEAGKSMAEIQTAVRNTLPQYQITKDQNLGAIQQRATGGLKPLAPVNAVKRQPGESAADFLKRSGG